MLPGISSQVKVIALKKAVQVSQNDFFSFQAGLEIAQFPFKLFDFVVPVGFSIKKRLVMLVRVKAELLHQINIENLPFQKLRKNERQKTFLAPLNG